MGNIKVFAKRYARIPICDICYFVFMLALIGNALDAYNVGSLPIPWIANFGVIFIVVFILFREKRAYFPGHMLFIVLFCWVVLTGVFNIFFEVQVPPIFNLTTSYYSFIILRYFSLISFASTLVIVFWLARKGKEEKVIELVVDIGFFVSLVAIYMYFAQIYGLPEPSRNRMGTGGGAQWTVFLYNQFHRAMGTFREPSLLAQWLVVPLFLSVYLQKKGLNCKTIVISATIMLSGSLTGIVGAVLGLFSAMLISFQLKIMLKMLLKCVVIVLFGLCVFSFFAVSNHGGEASLINTLYTRLMPIVENGMEVSGRGYVYNFIHTVPSAPLGYGLGYSNLLLTEWMKSEFIVSFLSLYFNFIYSAGFVGVLFLLLFLIYPIAKLLILSRERVDEKMLWLLSAYISWLVMFSVLSEEFTMMSGVVYALVMFNISEAQIKNKRYLKIIDDVKE